MKFLKHTLLVWYKNNGRKNLPWRKERMNAYEVWVSEMMLQQTQVERVMPYYTKFLKKFPDIFSLSQSSWENFVPYYQGLGYYRRGRNMLTTAKILVEQYGGMFPHDKDLLVELHGIGEYTASAILSFAYSDSVLAFDTNHQKVFGRYLYGTRYAKVDQKTITVQLAKIAPELNAAIMDFSGTVCKTKPLCPSCPLETKCAYSKTQGKKEFLPATKRLTFPMRFASVHLWLHKEHKEYYSKNPDTFEVFQLSQKYNTREKIKQYFRKHYGLEIAAGTVVRSRM